MIVRKVQRLHHSLVITIPRGIASRMSIVRGDYVQLQTTHVAGMEVITIAKMEAKLKTIEQIERENGR